MKVSLLYACNDYQKISFINDFLQIQSMKDIEVIIIYNGDEFKKFFHLCKLPFNGEVRHFWYKKATNQEALTFGLRQARGTMVTRIDPNITYFTNFLEKLYNPNYDFVYSKWIEEDEEINPTIRPTLKRLRCYLWKTQFLQWIGGWKDQYPNHQDLSIIYKTFLISNYTYFINESLAQSFIQENRLLEYYMESQMQQIIIPPNPNANTLYQVDNIKNEVQQLLNLESFLFHHPQSYVIINKCYNHYYFMDNYPNALFGKYYIKQAKTVDTHYFYTKNSKLLLNYENINDALHNPDILYLFRCKKQRCGSLLIGIHNEINKDIQRILKQHLVIRSDSKIDSLMDVIIWTDDQGEYELLNKNNKIHILWIDIFQKCNIKNATIAFPFINKNKSKYKFVE